MIEVDADKIVISFEEKPEQPESNLAEPRFYIYQKVRLPMIAQYLAEGENPDAPSNFVLWLV